MSAIWAKTKRLLKSSLGSLPAPNQPELPYNTAAIENLQVLQGRLFARINRQSYPLRSLREAEFKVFSQFGEDGILQYLIEETSIQVNEEVFVEFGVQDYSESNTRFLLVNNNWRGLIIDGNEQFMQSVRKTDYYWRHDLTAVTAWIDKDNINDLIRAAGITGEIGLLSIDVDGNDYWIWKAIDVISPVIVAVEWNSIFGGKHALSIPYDRGFRRAEAHYSCLYWGTSIAALEYLGKMKGYVLVGSNTSGNNLFFVRKDRLGRLKEVSSHEAYVRSRFRESRDPSGNLNYLSYEDARAEIRDMPLINVKTLELTSLRKLEFVSAGKEKD